MWFKECPLIHVLFGRELFHWRYLLAKGVYRSFTEICVWFRFPQQRAIAVWPARHRRPAIFLDRAAPPARAAKPGPTKRARARLFRFRISLPQRAEARLSSQSAGSLAAGNPIACCA